MKTKDKFSQLIILAGLLIAAFSTWKMINYILFISKISSISISTLKLPAIYLFGLIVGVLIVIYSKRLVKNFANLLLFAISILVVLVLLEVILNIWLCKFPTDEKIAKYANYGQCGFIYKYRPDPYLLYTTSENFTSMDGKNKHNSMGFRGDEVKMPKPEGVYRILALGESSTYDINIKDWRDSYPAQLERILAERYGYKNVEVVNGGVGGYISNEIMLSFLLKGIYIKPDMIILYLGANDVHTRTVKQEDYKPDASGFRKIWSDRKSPFYYRFILFKLLVGYNPMQSVDSFISAKDPDEIDVPYWQKNQELWKKRLEINKPVYFENNVRTIVDIAKENNISVLLVTFAQNPNFEGDMNNCTWFYNGIVEHNQVIKQVGRETGAKVFELDKTILPLNKSFWSDGRHNNEAGARRKAELIAEFMVDNDMIMFEKIDGTTTQ